MLFQQMAAVALQPQRVNMLYSRYKKHYSDCETVSGSYCKITKTIDVIVPLGRMKKSGVRGESFQEYIVECAELVKYGDDDETPTHFFAARAISGKNAIKQAKRAKYTPLRLYLSNRYGDVREENLIWNAEQGFLNGEDC